jgi:hypothetical protein
MNAALESLARHLHKWDDRFLSAAWPITINQVVWLPVNSHVFNCSEIKYYTKMEWHLARLALGLDSSFTSPEEDEAWAEREAHINAIARNGEPAIEYTRTAEQFLSQAADLLIERGKQYDKPGGERSMGSTVKAFNAITNKTLSESEGWLFMSILKRVRQFQGPYHKDSAEDSVSYSALEAEALERGL